MRDMCTYIINNDRDTCNMHVYMLTDVPVDMRNTCNVNVDMRAGDTCNMYVGVHVPVTYTHVHVDMGDTCNMQVYTSKHACTCRPACNMYVHVPLHHALHVDMGNACTHHEPHYIRASG